MPTHAAPDPHAAAIAAAIGIRPAQARAAIDLLDAGNTLPFVARYRKEATGGLDDDQLRRLADQLAHLRGLDERRATVLASIDAQGLLTDALRAEIAAAASRAALEDLYQPFKPKRRTRATIAREHGLQGLADLILRQPATGTPPADLARPYLSDAVATPDDALAGARDIVAEAISDHPGIRGATREKALRWATVRAARVDGAEDPKTVYALYYDFRQRADRVQPYQVLAINRGEAEKVLRVAVDVPERDWRAAVAAHARPDPRSSLSGELAAAIDDAADRLLLPAIARDVRRALTEAAEAHAIAVFGRNLRGLLTQPPLAGRTVLGLDPGFRTGCKAAVVDPTGKALATGTIHPHAPQRQWAAARAALERWIDAHGVTLIAIGNGTASRETEALAAEVIADRTDLHYLIVNEAGASVYSASALAAAELPGMDVSLRGAVSIARRAQDPLAELVKIDPKAIGVGLYQHDVDQAALARAVDGVVESVVNAVGVDVNTASPALLARVAGIGPKLAERIVAHRDAEGAFRSRAGLRRVAGLGPKAFEQAAGFLRVGGGDEPLDASAIHPESYPIARGLLAAARLAPDGPPADRQAALDDLVAGRGIAALAAELGAGVPTTIDILEQLVRPGRDPRADLPPPLLRGDVLSVDDLRIGMVLKGTVRNLVDFGAFVDIGVKHDGLLHRSRLPRGTVLGVGDVVDVSVVSIEAERGRIGLGWNLSDP
ncbi:RNA-binding transcriptional accessory protein [bacterium]|nr:MAG: RNA-binding transcriptional accessory protein [bacterium]